MQVISLLVVCIHFIPNGKGDYYKPEGSVCKWENVTGICVDARKCTTFETDLEDKKPPPICSFQGEHAIICCTACEIRNTTEPEYKPVNHTTGIKHVDKCNEYYRTLPYTCKPHVTFWSDKTLITALTGRRCHVVAYAAVAPAGGEDAERGQYPHMALLGYGAELPSAQWLCGGSIISTRFILTAGHCRSHAQLGPVRYIALGILKRSDPPEYWQQYNVKRFIPHPGFRPPSKYNDIGLIETDNRIKFSEDVLPACVYGRDVDGDEAYATGWGGLGRNRGNADTLQEVALKKFTTEECSRLYPPHRLLIDGYNHMTQMCYGDHDEIKDTCGGDSGGPLQREIEESHKCLKHIIGVTSYGHECGHAGVPGMYTRVQHYVPWIESLVWP